MPYADHDASVYDLELQMDSPRDPRALEIRMIGKGKRVLELGSAGGVTTKALAANGCSVVAIEIDGAAAERAAAHTERVIVGDLDVPETLAQLANEKFDVVLAGDVLEHLRDPLSVVQAAALLLEPDGFLVVSIPNVAHADVRLSLLGGHFPYSDTGLLDSTHLRFFTLDSFESLLAEAGFVIADLERLRAPIFSTELKVDPATVSSELVTELLNDPEAETYQFVLRAVVRFTDDAREALARRSTALAAELAHHEELSRRLRRELDDLIVTQNEERAESVAALALAHEQLALAHDRLLEADAHAGRLDEENVALREHVVALQSTKLYRFAAPLRSIYSRARRQ